MYYFCLLGAITTTFPSNDRSTAFVGNWLVKEQYRNKGIGIQLWKAVMEYLKRSKSTKIIGLQAQPENPMVSFYLKQGFSISSQNEIAIYRGFFCLLNCESFFRIE